MDPRPTQIEPTHGIGTRAARWVGRALARWHYARHVEPSWFEINRPEIEIAGLPKQFDGLRIAQLSDLHCGGHLPKEIHHAAIDAVLSETPDLIAVTGDFVHKGYGHVDEIGTAMRRLQARLGVFAVLGNHDFSVRNALGIRRHRGLHLAIQDSLQRNGVNVLRNQTVHFGEPTERIYLAGLDDLWSRECDPDIALKNLNPDSPRIVLAHNPQTLHRLGDHRCDLMLSGHTHGGQINLTSLGRIFLARSARKLAAGLYRHGDKQVYVNKGIGCGVRFRYRVRPELAMITLRRRSG